MWYVYFLELNNDDLYAGRAAQRLVTSVGSQVAAFRVATHTASSRITLLASAVRDRADQGAAARELGYRASVVGAAESHIGDIEVAPSAERDAVGKCQSRGNPASRLLAVGFEHLHLAV